MRTGEGKLEVVRPLGWLAPVDGVLGSLGLLPPEAEFLGSLGSLNLGHGELLCTEAAAPSARHLFPHPVGVGSAHLRRNGLAQVGDRRHW